MNSSRMLAATLADIVGTRGRIAVFAVVTAILTNAESQAAFLTFDASSLFSSQVGLTGDSGQPEPSLISEIQYEVILSEQGVTSSFRSGAYQFFSPSGVGAGFDRVGVGVDVGTKLTASGTPESNGPVGVRGAGSASFGALYVSDGPGSSLAFNLSIHVEAYLAPGDTGRIIVAGQLIGRGGSDVGLAADSATYTLDQPGVFSETLNYHATIDGQRAGGLEMVGHLAFDFVIERSASDAAGSSWIGFSDPDMSVESIPPNMVPEPSGLAIGSSLALAFIAARRFGRLRS